MDTKQNFFTKPAVVRAVGIVAATGGFYFLTQNITGNVIKNPSSFFSGLSFIGLILLACSAILIIHSFKK